MNSKYKVSVIIPVYNTEKYLNDCVESVLIQSLREIEIIFIDDGSTDNSYKIMEAYKNRYANIKLFKQENKRQGAARNKGIELAEGEYIFFLDSDDYIDKNTLEILYKTATKDNLELLTYDAKVEIDGILPDTVSNYSRSHLDIDIKKVWFGRNYFNTYYKIGGVFVSPCLLFTKREILLEKKIKFVEKVYYEDNSFAIDLFWGVSRMSYLPQQLYIRRYRKDSVVTSQYTDVHLNGACKTCELAIKYLIVEKDSSEDIDSLIRYNNDKAIVLLEILTNFDLVIRNENKRYIIDLCLKLIENNVLTSFNNFNLELAIYYKNILGYILKIEYIYKSNFLMELQKIQSHLEEKIKKVLMEIKNKLNFMKETNEKICIYGTGKIAKRLIRFLALEWDDIRDNLIFMETKVKEKGYEDGFQIVSLSEIKKYYVHGIIIASTIYEHEMRNNITSMYGNKYACLSYEELTKRLN